MFENIKINYEILTQRIYSEGTILVNGIPRGPRVPPPLNPTLPTTLPRSPPHPCTVRGLRDNDIVCGQQVLLAVGLYARASVALPVYHEDYDYDGHHGHGHHAPPPATSYATVSTTHVKVQHPPAAPPKYSAAVPAAYKVSETSLQPQSLAARTRPL